jgi:acyl-CoA thioester hydrolase
VCYQAGVVSPVYTAQVTVRHDELDRFGRVHPGVYLRYLAHAAVEASTAAGYDAAWYAAAGAMWLVRRSTFELADPARAEERLAIRTWVEDFRRVRSHRRYAVHGADGRLCMDALTDWVYVDAGTGRPRRVPADLEAAFGVAVGSGRERESWNGPPPPTAPALGSHRVRACEVDTIGHVNNAVYLDLAGQATLDVLEDTGWPLERMITSGAVPVLRRADLEYLEGARYGDRLEIATWFAAADDGLEAHQRLVRQGGERPLVRVATRWQWADPTSAAPAGPPPDLLAALRPLLAA